MFIDKKINVDLNITPYPKTTQSGSQTLKIWSYKALFKNRTPSLESRARWRIIRLDMKTTIQKKEQFINWIL